MNTITQNRIEGRITGPSRIEAEQPDGLQPLAFSIQPALRPARKRRQDVQTLPLKLSGAKRWESLQGGLYRDLRTGTLYERPTIAGTRTWRSLETGNERVARQKMAGNQIAQAKAEIGSGPSPYAKETFITTGQVIAKYLADGCPDRQRRLRPKKTRDTETRNCATLQKFWNTVAVEQVTLAVMDKYCDTRIKEVKTGARKKCSQTLGYRTVDLELCTLNNAFVWAVRGELVKYNPLSEKRPKYSSEKTIQHCREFMPMDANQLHDVARQLFADPRSETLGWQYLLEAFTGLRTSEALQLRMDALPGAPGYLMPNRNLNRGNAKSLSVSSVASCEMSYSALHVGRSKNGINPFVVMTPHLEQLLRALFAWQRARCAQWLGEFGAPPSPWYLMSLRNFGQHPVDGSALAHALRRLRGTSGSKLTSHGARAYYVTARRSWGISDIQIAIEIGHRGGPGLLTTTYGGVPTNWLTGDGPKMTWLPENAEPAWSVLNLKENNILQLPTLKTAIR